MRPTLGDLLLEKASGFSGDPPAAGGAGGISSAFNSSWSDEYQDTNARNICAALLAQAQRGSTSRVSGERLPSGLRPEGRRRKRASVRGKSPSAWRTRTAPQPVCGGLPSRVCGGLPSPVCAGLPCTLTSPHKRGEGAQNIWLRRVTTISRSMGWPAPRSTTSCASRRIFWRKVIRLERN